MTIRHFRVAWPLYQYLHLLFARLARRLSSSRFPLLAAVRVVERIVDLSRNPQAVQEHAELPSHGHRRPFLRVLAAPGRYLLSVASQVRVRSERSQDV